MNTKAFSNIIFKYSKSINLHTQCYLLYFWETKSCWCQIRIIHIMNKQMIVTLVWHCDIKRTSNNIYTVIHIQLHYYFNRINKNSCWKCNSKYYIRKLYGEDAMYMLEQYGWYIPLLCTLVTKFRRILD